jgi:hypothetical protein
VSGRQGRPRKVVAPRPKPSPDTLLHAAGFKPTTDDGNHAVWLYVVDPFRVRLTLPKSGAGRGTLEVNGKTVRTRDALADALHFVRTVRW